MDFNSFRKNSRPSRRRVSFSNETLTSNNLKSTNLRAIVKMERVNSRKEQAMTDWDMILENIRNAMQAVDEAHEASHDLRTNATPDTFDEFRVKMAELTEHLTRLQTVLNNEEAFAMDELVDWISKTYTGKPSEYRRTPRMKMDVR
jgi:hypothetical protein